MNNEEKNLINAIKRLKKDPNSSTNKKKLLDVLHSFYNVEEEEIKCKCGGNCQCDNENR
jgi:hypothetical protein